MNRRVVTGVVGTVITVLGLAGLFWPERVLPFVGFTILNPSQAAAALGEVRATYGGIFLVMGVATLLATLDPSRHRARLGFIGALWLGACAGRVFGASVDGNPGIIAWLTAVFELAVGGSLVFIAATSAEVRPATGAEMARAG